MIHINFTIFFFDGSITRKTIKYDKKHEHELEVLWENTCFRLKNNKIRDDDLTVFLGHSIVDRIRQRKATYLIQDEFFDEIRNESAISKMCAQARAILLEAAIDDRPKQIITIKQRETDPRIS